MINVYLLFLSDFKPERDSSFLPAILVIVGILSPISFLNNQKFNDKDYLYAIISLIVGLVISIISGIVLKEDNNDFISDFYAALSSKGFSIFYLLSLVVSIIISWRMRCIGIIVTVFLIGMLSPFIIAAAFFLVIIIIIIVILLIFGGKELLQDFCLLLAHVKEFLRNLRLIFTR